MIARLAAPSAEFPAPGPKDFEFAPIFGVVTKPMLIIVLAAVVVAAFFYLAARRPNLVPGKLQFAGEQVYGFVRNGIARDSMGAAGQKFVPYLVTIFSFILVMNISGIVPGIQFPATSRVEIPLFLALISWAIFNIVGIRRQGFLGYFRNMMFPPGIPWPVYILLAPIEFVSTVVIRPITLTLRLALNMFAGHLVLLLCILGGEYLLFHGGAVGWVIGPVAFFFGIVMTFFEGFVQILQAYVFTLLSALYIAGALADEH